LYAKVSEIGLVQIAVVNNSVANLLSTAEFNVDIQENIVSVPPRLPINLRIVSGVIQSVLQIGVWTSLIIIVVFPGLVEGLGF
jgi:hypothetical protein